MTWTQMEQNHPEKKPGCLDLLGYVGCLFAAMGCGSVILVSISTNADNILKVAKSWFGN
ncbi:MAG: hypothetical protein WAV40_00610 [Microgenomates group bacterium]